MLTQVKSTFHFNVASYHLRMGRFREAVAGFSEVIRLSPNYAAAYVNRGVAFQGMNDHRRAISDFDRAIAIGFNLDSHRVLAYFGRGVSWKLVGEFDRAAADYRQALALTPRFSPGHEELGVIAHLRYDFDAAVAHLDQAIKLSPRHASHYKTRGRVYFDCGDFVAAEADLRYAINLADDAYALLFWYLASCKMRRNTAQELESRARRLKGRQWPFTIITLYLGKVGDDAVRAAATGRRSSTADISCGDQFWTMAELIRIDLDVGTAIAKMRRDRCQGWCRTAAPHRGAVYEYDPDSYR